MRELRTLVSAQVGRRDCPGGSRLPPESVTYHLWGVSCLSPSLTGQFVDCPSGGKYTPNVEVCWRMCECEASCAVGLYLEAAEFSLLLTRG